MITTYVTGLAYQPMVVAINQIRVSSKCNFKIAYGNYLRPGYEYLAHKCINQFTVNRKWLNLHYDPTISAIASAYGQELISITASPYLAFFQPGSTLAGKKSWYEKATVIR